MTTKFAANERVAEIRRLIDHPVVDADGHQLEFVPLLRTYVEEVAGKDVARHFEQGSKRIGSIPLAMGAGGFAPARVFFVTPSRNSLDRMTATLPALLYDRLDEIGIDYLILYPTLGLGLMAQPDQELRQAVVRALNIYNAEQYAPFRDRIEPVAVIPTFTPEEAITELDYAVGHLGLKAVVMSGVIPRSKTLQNGVVSWVDSLAHGSIHDYDKVWKRCVELGVSPTFHGSGKGWGTRMSSTNYVFNHLGGFAAAQEAICRSLVIGGAPLRFPELRFSFLEGGISWSLQLYHDLLGHFDKRNKDAVGLFDPRLLDLDECERLFTQFASERMSGLWSEYASSARDAAARISEDPLAFDDFTESGISDPSDIIRMFADQFSFGCEADDPLNALSYDGRLLPEGRPLRAMFGSDIGHWDTTDMRSVVSEAWELVEDGQATEGQFRDFVFGNIVSMMTATNRGFFEGTVLEGVVASPSSGAAP